MCGKHNYITQNIEGVKADYKYKNKTTVKKWIVNINSGPGLAKANFEMGVPELYWEEFL